MLDHGTGVVIGETAVIGNGVSILHVSISYPNHCLKIHYQDHDFFSSSRLLEFSLSQGVTLGGTGKETGDRHPKIGEGALLGACVTILGNISVGAGAMVAAGSLVLKDVPSHRYKKRNASNKTS